MRTNDAQSNNFCFLGTNLRHLRKEMFEATAEFFNLRNLRETKNKRNWGSEFKILKIILENKNIS